MQTLVWFVCLGWGLLAGGTLTAAAQSGSGVAVVVEILADSSNHLEARLQVAPGTNGRDLMERLFKMDYADFTRRFVTGIAGFKAESRQRQFWKLEIDGETAKVGIAGVVIQRPMRLCWRLAKY
ncbi:MAG: DUF4430 domain-containing protein [candidate division KSB1 bacterium]|nr:DUF4430 domain-containing protein [candidate division KSB1 bacterium]MDZ7274856.1 DUF4430 domain-containing protein [candidate division KSB1 bacterium]MDZ7288223.1 DUF4430 domain-containing protein [candidate division KSB1 bacterium]MDZ7300396.1 DUF4430 domain-containing protein [candidate division KSB1 bacterium]MDZ7308771.1 DUF4430 domain-containing protein [candidate division KSB1 bacterium]